MVLSVALTHQDLLNAVRGDMPDNQIEEITDRKGKIAKRVYSYPFARSLLALQCLDSRDHWRPFGMCCLGTSPYFQADSWTPPKS